MVNFFFLALCEMGGSGVKVSAYNTGNMGLIPALEDPLERKMANPLQYSS